jgi:hypothetical protein
MVPSPPTIHSSSGIAAPGFCACPGLISRSVLTRRASLASRAHRMRRAALEQALARDAPTLIEVKVGAFPDPWQHIVLSRVRG